MASSNGAAPKQDQQQQRPATIADLLERRKDEIAKVLPKHLTVDRLARVALTAIGKTPRLQECTGASLLQSIMQAAELGLEPGGALGHAYLVPFKQKNGPTLCTLIIGYRGLIELARRSGELVQIEAHIIREGDVFEEEYGLHPKFRHVPKRDGALGRMLGVYMIARTTDGGTHIEMMTSAEVDRIRMRSRSKDDGPWVTDPDEMAKKTVIKRGMKYLSLSSERLKKAAEIDDNDFIDGEVTGRVDGLAAVVDLPAEARNTGTAALKKKLAPRAESRVIDVPTGQSEEEAEAASQMTEAPPSAQRPAAPETTPPETDIPF